MSGLVLNEYNLPQFRSISQSLEPFLAHQFSAVKCSAHDIEHCYRVANTAVNLANYDTTFTGRLSVVYSAGLLHDVFDPKLFSSDELIPMESSLRSLLAVHIDEIGVNDVVKIAQNVGYKHLLDKSKEDLNALPLEYRYVQDADLLDAIGAIGVARCMAYSGKINRPLFRNDGTHTSIEDTMDKQKYENRQKDSTATAVDHFYEKLLRIKDLILTESGKRVAQRRHEMMERFLEDLSTEIREAHIDGL